MDNKGDSHSDHVQCALGTCDSLNIALLGNEIIIFENFLYMRLFINILFNFKSKSHL